MSFSNSFLLGHNSFGCRKLMGVEKNILEFIGKKTERTLKKESVEKCSNAVYLLVVVFWLTVALRLIVICKNPTCPNHSNFRVKPETGNKKID